MKTFLVFEHLDGRIEAVKDGFSFPGFVCGGFWLMWHRMWGAGAIALISGFGVYVLLPSPEGFIYGVPYGHKFGLADVLNICVCAVVGALGNHWRCSSLGDRGFEHVGTEHAATPDGAKAAYLRRDAKPNMAHGFSRKEPT